MDIPGLPNINPNENTASVFPGHSIPGLADQPPVVPAAPVTPAVPGVPATPTLPEAYVPVPSPFTSSQPAPIMPPTPIANNPVAQNLASTIAADSNTKKSGKTKELFLLGLLILLLAGAVFGFTKVRSLLTGAEEEGCAPQNVAEESLTGNSIIVVFTTKEACKMQVAYGVDEVLGLQMSEQIASTEHRIKLSPLMPQTAYKYQIRNGEQKFEPTRGFLTLPLSAPAASPSPIVVPTRSAVTTTTPTSGATTSITPTRAAVPTTSASGTTPTSSATTKYTITDFQLHFGSVDPRFDTDKNGIVNYRDWILYSQ